MYEMTIAGATRRADERFAVVNPATEQLVAEAPQASSSDLDDAVAAAVAAIPEWSSDAVARARALRAAADVYRRSAAELGPVFTMEQGRPLPMAIGEIAMSAAWFDHYAGLDLVPEIVEGPPGVRLEISRRPVGPVAAITPWNAPILLAVWKIAAALAAGNAVVLKPSPFTPLTTLALGQRLQAVLPPGVLNVVSGHEPLGQRMVAHAAIRKVSFTGSVPVGRAVASGAAEGLKRVTLELGGNDAAILLDDVDVDAIAPQILLAAFVNGGQICEAVKRVYVPATRHADVVDALADLARGMRVGDGLDPDTQMGPLTTATQRDRVAELVDDARHHGARVVVGGRRPERPGYFYEPTIVDRIAEGTRLVDEEQFGPALPVLTYTDIDEALERANGTSFGLSSSVWSADAERALAVGRKLQAGRVRINGFGMPTPDVPFGGIKSSGIGVENGLDGLHEYTVLHVTEIHAGEPHHQPGRRAEPPQQGET